MRFFIQTTCLRLQVVQQRHVSVWAAEAFTEGGGGGLEKQAVYVRYSPHLTSGPVYVQAARRRTPSVCSVSQKVYIEKG